MTFTSPARVKYEMRAPSRTRIGASVTEPDLAKADGEEVEADDQRGDRRAGKSAMCGHTDIMP